MGLFSWQTWKSSAILRAGKVTWHIQSTVSVYGESKCVGVAMYTIVKMSMCTRGCRRCVNTVDLKHKLTKVIKVQSRTNNWSVLSPLNVWGAFSDVKALSPSQHVDWMGEASLWSIFMLIWALQNRTHQSDHFTVQLCQWGGECLCGGLPTFPCATNRRVQPEFGLNFGFTQSWGTVWSATLLVDSNTPLPVW